MAGGLGNARLYRAMHVVFYVLLATSAVRLVVRHGSTDGYVLIAMGLASVFGTAYGLAATSNRGVWLGAMLISGLTLMAWAPSFTWCAIPLFFLCLRVLPRRQAIGVAVALTAAIIVAQLRTADILEPSLVLGPIAVAALAAIVLLELERTGRLEERERLAREIHDTLAQGLSSMQMMLQAAERAWDTDPSQARRLVHQTAETAGKNLAEARRFISGLHPPELDDRSLRDALARLSAQANAEFDLSGTPYAVPAAAEAALLRVAQQALANVADHAQATRVAVTLSYLPGQITLDVRDDGVGFDPSSTSPAPGHGHGQRSMRDRLAEFDGGLVIESAPGEGTGIAATIPVEDSP